MAKFSEDVDTVGKILSIINGSQRTTSGGTTSQVTSSSLTPEQIELLANRVLQSQFARTARRQRSRGLYNSTANQALLENLAVQAATDAAAKGATKTVNTTTPKQIVTTKMPNALTQLALAGAGMLAKSALAKPAGEVLKKSVDSIINPASEAVFAGGAADVFTATADQLFGNSLSQVGSGVSNIAAGDLGLDLFTKDITDIASGATTEASSGFLDSVFGSGAGIADSVPYANIVANALDGEWGWSDTGSAIGSIFGPVGTFVGSVLGGPVGNIVEDIGGEIWGGIEEVGGFVSDAIEGVGNAIGGLFSGCFITTAVCAQFGKPDDCEELTKFREFRDSYVIPNHPEAVKEYYETAPFIVNRIYQSPHRAQILHDLYYKHIKPALAAMEVGDNEKAYRIYSDMVATAKERAGYGE